MTSYPTKDAKLLSVLWVQVCFALLLSAPALRPEKEHAELQLNNEPEPLECSDLKSCLALLGTANPAAAERAAHQTVNDPAYTLNDFETDCKAAFPELELYRVKGGTLGNRGGEAEYQRTLGALFSVYWLVRKDMEGDASGMDGFCFGVDSSGRSKTEQDETIKNLSKRTAFKHNSEVWAQIDNLTTNAGFKSKTDTTLLRSMLALTAIHDIMKIEALIPKNEIDTTDHDLALGYVLKHQTEYPLPSYQMLSDIPAGQNKVLFALAEMNFNFGHMVQAEAPPGALFKDLMGVIHKMRDTPAELDKQLLFYFFHWFTDLAGATANPKGGNEIFILKLPTVVLLNFFNAMSHVRNLGSGDETQVYLDYLRSTPAGVFVKDNAQPQEFVALTRLILMSQAGELAVKDAFTALDPESKRTLTEELSVTGTDTPFPEGAPPSSKEGPAFLVYYGPKLLQLNKKDGLSASMQLLAGIFAKARAEFAQRPSGQTMTIMLEDPQGLAEAAKAGVADAIGRLSVDAEGKVSLAGR
mmetsp:Transcript_23470/g.42337  ORF Transcript_23470/g.42337 Transcript_23470/m.42337 type:complete len:526 (+) Transcript_23470:53-1630(+)